MTETQFCIAVKVSTNAVAKKGRDEDVRVEALVKICCVLNCAIDEIMEIFPDKPDISAHRNIEYMILPLFRELFEWKTILPTLLPGNFRWLDRC